MGSRTIPIHTEQLQISDAHQKQKQVNLKSLLGSQVVGWSGFNTQIQSRRKY